MDCLTTVKVNERKNNFTLFLEFVLTQHNLILFLVCSLRFLPALPSPKTFVLL